MNAKFPGYSEPHDTLTQNLDSTVTPAINRMNPVLMGTQYLLSLNDGRTLAGQAFVAAGATVPFQYAENGSTYTVNTATHTTELTSVELIADALEAKVSGITNSGSLTVSSISSSPYRLRCTGVLYSTGNTALETHLDGRAVVVGDILRVTSTSGGAVAKCKVTGYIPKVLVPTVGAVIPTLVSPSTIGTPTVTGTYVSPSDDTFVVTVTSIDGTNVNATIHDTAGLYPLQNVSWLKAEGDHSVPLENGAGITMVIHEGASGGSAKSVVGNVYSVTVTNVGVSSTDFDGVTLDTPAFAHGYNGALTADVYVRVSGKLTAANAASGTLATFTSAGAAYTANNLGVLRGSVFCPFADGGRLNLAFRAAKIASATESAILINPGDDLSAFGENKVENDLAYGIRAMQAGAGSSPIYVLRVSDDTVESYEAGLKKLRSSDIYYAFAALTKSTDVVKALRSDILTSSSAGVMKWRKGYVGFDSPDAYELWGLIPETANYRKATLLNGLVTVDVGDREYGDFIGANVRAGDLIKFASKSTSLTVSAVLPGSEGQSWQLLISESTADITQATAFTITKPNSAENIADYIMGVASDVGGTLGDGRITLLWGDALQTALAGSGFLPNRYLAAWAAGIRCSLFPQQGIATYEVPIVASAPTMHTKFTPELLSDMCASGVLVVSQSSAETPVQVVDQVTTCTSGGLERFQDNIHVIVDSFSYAIKDGQVGLKGRKNATKVTASAIKKKTQATAIDYCQVPLSEYQIAGPRVMAFYDKDGNPNQVTVERSQNFVNRIATYVQIDVPVPLNGIDNVVRVSIGTTF